MTNKAEASASASRGGIGFTGLLVVVLIVLKLNPGGYLDSQVQGWSWWLVLFGPLLLSVGIFVSVLVLLGIVFGIVFSVVAVYENYQDRKRKKERKRRAEALANPRIIK